MIMIWNRVSEKSQPALPIPATLPLLLPPPPPLLVKAAIAVGKNHEVLLMLMTAAAAVECACALRMGDRFVSEAITGESFVSEARMPR